MKLARVSSSWFLLFPILIATTVSMNAFAKDVDCRTATDFRSGSGQGIQYKVSVMFPSLNQAVCLHLEHNRISEDANLYLVPFHPVSATVTRLSEGAQPQTVLFTAFTVNDLGRIQLQKPSKIVPGFEILEIHRDANQAPVLDVQTGTERQYSSSGDFGDSDQVEEVGVFEDIPLR